LSNLQTRKDPLPLSRHAGERLLMPPHTYRFFTSSCVDEKSPLTHESIGSFFSLSSFVRDLKPGPRFFVVAPFAKRSGIPERLSRWVEGSSALFSNIFSDLAVGRAVVPFSFPPLSAFSSFDFFPQQRFFLIGRPPSPCLLFIFAHCLLDCATS